MVWTSKENGQRLFEEDRFPCLFRVQLLLEVRSALHKPPKEHSDGWMGDSVPLEKGVS